LVTDLPAAATSVPVLLKADRPGSRTAFQIVADY
jgi:hypothetical protein